MARTGPRPAAETHRTLNTTRRNCPPCRRSVWADYTNYRAVIGLAGSVRLTLKVRRCHNRECGRFRKP